MAYSWLKDLVNSYLPPVIIVFGLIGNLLNIVIYSKKNFCRKQRLLMAYYFKLLSVFDFVSMLQFGPFYLNNQFNLDIKSKSLYLCRTLMVLLFVPSSVSAWLQVLISLELVNITNNKPLFSSTVSKFVSIVVVLIPNLVVYSPLAFFYELKKVKKGDEKLNDTNINNNIDSLSQSVECVLENQPLRTYLGWIDLINFTFIPFILMSTFSIIMIVNMTKRRRKLSGLTKRRRSIRDVQFSMTSIFLNLIYLVFNLPITVLNVVTAHIDKYNEQEKFLFSVFINLYYFKLAIPIFIYAFVNKYFRLELFNLCLPSWASWRFRKMRPT